MSQVAEQNTHQACCRFDVGLVGRFDVSLESVTNSAQTNSKKKNKWFTCWFLLEDMSTTTANLDRQTQIIRLCLANLPNSLNETQSKELLAVLIMFTKLSNIKHWNTCNPTPVTLVTLVIQRNTCNQTLEHLIEGATLEYAILDDCSYHFSVKQYNE